MQPFQTDLTTTTQHLVTMELYLLMAQKQSELREAPPCDAILPSKRSKKQLEFPFNQTNVPTRLEQRMKKHSRA